MYTQVLTSTPASTMSMHSSQVLPEFGSEALEVVAALTRVLPVFQTSPAWQWKKATSKDALPSGSTLEEPFTRKDGSRDTEGHLRVAPRKGRAPT